MTLPPSWPRSQALAIRQSLFTVATETPNASATSGTDMLARNVLNFPIAPGNIPDLKEQATAFENMAAINAGPGPFVADDGKPEQIVVANVTPTLLWFIPSRPI